MSAGDAQDVTGFFTAEALDIAEHHHLLLERRQLADRLRQQGT
jgi:hypothetical protein